MTNDEVYSRVLKLAALPYGSVAYVSPEQFAALAQNYSAGEWDGFQKEVSFCGPKFRDSRNVAFIGRCLLRFHEAPSGSVEEFDFTKD